MIRLSITASISNLRLIRGMCDAVLIKSAVMQSLNKIVAQNAENANVSQKLLTTE